MVNRNLIKLCIIVLLIGLVGYIFITSRSLSCEQCTITFTSSKSVPLTYNMSDLFNQTKIKQCPIIWERTTGYVKA